MAAEFEIVRVSTNFTGDPLPTSNAVIGSTAHTGLDVSMYGWLKRTQYKSIAAASTWSLSTAGYIDRVTVIPNTTGAATVVISDGSTAILSIPAAAHAVSATPYTVHLGIRSKSTLGFKVVTGASVACMVVGSFVNTPTTA